MSQINLFGGLDTASSNGMAAVKAERVSNGEYIFCPGFFNAVESEALFEDLKKNIHWKQESMNMYGKRIDFPRLTAWYGDNDKPYSFSGITLNPHPWTQTLLHIKALIEPTAGVSFNSVLLNLYRHGNDSVSWHTDAEPELGKNPVIASVNFGETRNFQLRHTQTKEKIAINLTNGSLLIMRGELQHFWQHQVPKTAKKIKDRINLTFRVIK